MQDRLSVPRTEHGLPLMVEQSVPECAHGSVSLDTMRRMVRCRDCDTVFDPFSFLLKHARALDEALTMRRQAGEEAERLRGVVDDLAREERRLKTAVSRLQVRGGELLPVSGRL